MRCRLASNASCIAPRSAVAAAGTNPASAFNFASRYVFAILSPLISKARIVCPAGWLIALGQPLPYANRRNVVENSQRKLLLLEAVENQRLGRGKQLLRAKNED